MYTAFDCVSYLLDSTGGGAQDSYHRVLRQAVFHSYREVITAMNWRWYETSEAFDLDDDVVIKGTVPTVEDLPSDAEMWDAYLVSDKNRRYRLQPVRGWVDIGPHGYYEHLLPWGVQSVDSIAMNEPVGWNYQTAYLEPRDFSRLYANTTWNSSSPAVWTVDKSPLAFDRYRVRVLQGYQWPATGTMTYRRRPKDLRYTGFEPIARKGECSWNAQFTATLSNNVWRDDMVGAVLRIRDDNVYHPESLTGIHPYEDEAVVYELIDGSPSDAWVLSPTGKHALYNTCKYCITDALDISPGMYSAILSNAEMWVNRLTGKDYQTTFELYQKDLRLAFESDAVATISGTSRKHGYGPYGVYGNDGGYGYGSLWWLYIRPGSDGGVRGCNGGTGGPNADGTCELPCDVSGGTASTEFDDCGHATEES